MRVLTEEEKVKLETLAPYLTMEQVADALGVGRTTLHEIMKRDLDAGERYKKAKANMVTQIAASLTMRALSGDITAQIFFLKTQARWRETDKYEGQKGNARPVLNVVRHADAKKADDDAN